MSNDGHLNGLQAKMAARDKRHAKKGNKSATGKIYKMPARPVRITRAERREEHKERMAERRRHQLARRPGFTPISPAA